MTQSPHSEILNCLNTRPLGVPFSSILPTCALEGLAEKPQVAQHTARMPCGKQRTENNISSFQNKHEKILRRIVLGNERP